ncbi:host cell division inhibitor Icd-like protein [Escherichia coli]|nr:host cell division inhibitor Icd-like protein [Escherichia coli]
MKTGYTPEQGRGFVRPCETEKQQNRGFSDIKKAAPIRSRLSEQLTYCAKNEYEQWDYINRVAKRHNCRITGKEKATCHGGQCDQCPGLLVDCQPGGRFLFAFKRRGYFSTKGSRANLSGTLRFSVRVNALFISLRVFSRWRMIIDNALFCSSWLFIIITFKTMRRSTSHHGADSFYPLGSMPRCCNSLRRTRLIQVAKDVSPSALAASSSCALKSSGNRIWYGGERFSNGVDMVITLHYYTYMVITIVLAITQKSTPRSAGNTYGASNQQRKLGAVMVAVNHIPHLVHTQTAFVWRFIALSTAQPRVIHIVATSEQEARQQSPAGCVMVFAARIRQGVAHV